METAKNERTTAKRLLTMAQNRVMTAIEQDVDAEILQNRFKEAGERMNKVMEKHEEYLSLAYPEDEDVDPVETQWFSTVSDKYDEMEIKVRAKMKATTDALKEENVAGKQIKLSLLAAIRERDYEEVLLHAAIENLELGVKDDEVDMQTVTSAQQEMKDRMAGYQTAQRKIALNADNDEMKESMDKLKQFTFRSTNANLAAGKFIGRKNQQKQQQKSPVTKEASAPMFKMERMKMPTFDGNIRDFPRFLDDFEKYVLPKLSSESGNYALRSCLTGAALESVHNVDFNLDEMLKRLKDRFGRASKLADIIMSDIKRSKLIVEGDDNGFLRFVNLVENSYNDLCRIDMEQEISNSTIVSMIEERLPKSIKSQWCLKMCDDDESNKVDEKNKFPAFLQFLKKHRRAVEYSSSDLRSNIPQRLGSANYGQGSSTSRSNFEQEKCWIHPLFGHPIWRCREFLSMTVADRKTSVLSNRACTACLLTKCPGSTSVEHCSARFRCREPACGKPHNQLLHTTHSAGISSKDAKTNITGSVNHAKTEREVAGQGVEENYGAAILPIQPL